MFLSFLNSERTVVAILTGLTLAKKEGREVTFVTDDDVVTASTK
jgi:hypothetical protein